MRSLRRVVAATLGLLPFTLTGAQSPAQPLTTAPRPADVASADAIINALYDANTMLVAEKRGADRFRSLFLPGARLMPTSGSGSSRMIRVETVEEYLRQASRGPSRHGFSEREICRTSESFASIVQVFSTYETHRDSADTRPARGINSIQLFNDGTRWWVVGVLWDTERPDKPIPPEFLKRP